MEQQHEGAGPETTGNQEHPEEPERRRDEEPRIYVASLSDYNNGILHGAWINASQDGEDLHAEITAMLASSPTGNAEEFAVHDYEDFGQYAVDEYESLDRLSRIARGIHDHGLAFAAWAARCDPTDESVLDHFEDAYLGDWPDVEAYAEDLMDSFDGFDSLYDRLPAALQPYLRIDIEGFARDLELSGDITTATHAGGMWIFDGRV